MIVHGEQPWAEGQTGRYGWWREVEPLWDGTLRWEYVAPTLNFFTVLSRLQFAHTEWLNDTFLFGGRL